MTGKGLVKVVAFKVCREVALDVLCHLGRFHASPTAKHDTLFQVLVENLSLDVLAISANFACHADSDFILFQQFCYFGDKETNFSRVRI